MKNFQSTLVALLFLMFGFGSAATTRTALARPQTAVPKTVIKDARAKQMLLGAHRFSLQWISWDYFGKAVVTERGGTLYIKGEQRARSGGDYVHMHGRITEVSAKEFKFEGVVDMKVSHINNGAACKREGELTFAITGNRRYWRMQQMDNPCDGVTDYVDIFFR